MAQYHPVPRQEDIDLAGRSGMWLRFNPTEFVRKPHFLALISELLDLLKDPYVPDREAYVAVRRATRLLTAYVDECERKARPGEVHWPPNS